MSKLKAGNKDEDGNCAGEWMSDPLKHVGDAGGKLVKDVDWDRAFKIDLESFLAAFPVTETVAKKRQRELRDLVEPL